MFKRSLVVSHLRGCNICIKNILAEACYSVPIIYVLCSNYKQRNFVNRILGFHLLCAIYLSSLVLEDTTTIFTGAIEIQEFAFQTPCLQETQLTTPHQLVWRRLASLKVNLAELQSIVATNDKKRYQIELDPAGTLRAPNTRIASTTASDSADWRIRATQGHSIMTISSDQVFKPILLTDADCPDFVVHGTDLKPWKEIERSGGLKPMRRKHIHFATKLPDKLPPLDREYQSQSKAKEGPVDKVLSGMRLTSTIVIWVDVKKSLEGGVKWWRSENEVVLTEGIGEPKILGFEWFKWVEKRGSEEILYGEKVESGEVGELERRMDRLRVGLGEGEKADGEKVDGGNAPQEDVNGQKALQEKKANGDEKLGPAAAVKDNWDD